MLKNESGSYLVLEDGTSSDSRPASAIRRWWRFGRYAFDMSKFSSQGRDVTLGIRERYLVGADVALGRERSGPISSCPASSAPSCMTASWRRSIRSRSRP